MPETRVVNLKSGEPYDVYIGRQNPRYRVRRSKWANPFKIGPDGDREQVLAKYRAWLQEHPELLAALPELRGKVLGCWCKPLACHGDILAELAESVAI
jgi:hypothetical protein